MRSGGAMVLGKTSNLPGRPTNLKELGMGLLCLQWVLVGIVWTFFLSSIISLFPVSGKLLDMD